MYSDIVELLLDHGAEAGSEALELACKNGNTEILKLLLAHGAEASEYVHIDIVELLLEHGAEG